ncbi:hypothetical protein [Pseudoxanthomonas sp. PXM04]|uniref:hypothetical protein n=1 Tax=Pseudoxanthomonas sp. PXM04 TaxID=2769297 RepID=UPI001786C905|nr:hypothetical protein [Pseudoxanthomonas sp. PXM04]MBD9376163.1 hypothetical protein [Pseudoxanthomonas sp. PXM04]
MGRPTAIQALAATSGSNEFFVRPTPAELRKWTAIRYAVNRVAQQCAPGDPTALDKLKEYTLAEYRRLGGVA